MACAKLDTITPTERVSEHAGDGAADRFASGLIQHFLIAYIDANRPEPIKYLQTVIFPVPTQAGQLGIQWGGMPGQPQPEQVDFPYCPCTPSSHPG